MTRNEEPREDRPGTADRSAFSITPPSPPPRRLRAALWLAPLCLLMAAGSVALWQHHAESMTLEQARQRLRAATTAEERRTAVAALYARLAEGVDDLRQAAAGDSLPAEHARLALQHLHTQTQ